MSVWVCLWVYDCKQSFSHLPSVALVYVHSLVFCTHMHHTFSLTHKHNVYSSHKRSIALFLTHNIHTHKHTLQHTHIQSHTDTPTHTHTHACTNASIIRMHHSTQKHMFCNGWQIVGYRVPRMHSMPDVASHFLQKSHYLQVSFAERHNSLSMVDNKDSQQCSQCRQRV